MKKKLAALDLKFQLAGVGVFLVVLFLIGNMLVVSPQHAAAKKVQAQVDAQNIQIYKKRAELRAGLRPPTIQVADLFRLARAMPDRQDMPGIMLTLSQVARAAGVSFDLIEPAIDAGGVPQTGPYQTIRIHLLFNGDFYGLSDFLYRLRNLVVVRGGKLDATGRLFNVDTVTFNVQGQSFPQISAEIYVDAYVYGSAPVPPAPATTPGTTTTTTTTTTADSTATPPSGATAVGASG